MDAMNLKHRNPARGPAPKDSSSSSTCSSSATAIARSLSMDESETSMSTRSSDEQSRGTTVSDKDENSFQAAATSSEERPWTVLSDAEIKSLLIVASFAAVISPLTTSTYYPSITAISRDLGVSVSKINLTISTYQIFQGISPTITAALADAYGRRPAFLACFALYLCANAGLALQNDYDALLVLRCLQSAGSSGTFALAQAVTADIATRAERGKYLAYATMGTALGPVLGPVIGGLLTKYLGWRSNFCFLLLSGAVLSAIIFVFFRETARSVVGDGSVPPPWWNRSLLQKRALSKQGVGGAAPPEPNLASLERRKRRINPLSSLALLLNKENFIVAASGGALYAGYASVTSVLASQLQQRYGYDAVQVGLCYLPLGIGSLLAYRTTARLIDWNFEREAKKQGLQILKNQQTDITNFDLEKARLAFVLPMTLLSSGLLVAYGWQMQYRTALAPILITMFFLSSLLMGVMISNAALLTDLNRENAAAVGAAMNLTRLLFSAAAVAIIGPLNRSVGIGWTATITAGIWVLIVPLLGLVHHKGYGWRLQASERAGAPDTELETLVRS